MTQPTDPTRPQPSALAHPTRAPAQTLKFDLVVVGGGLAGLSTAIAAARAGARVALLQDRPVFGGSSSSEVRVVPYGASHGAAWANETGIAHEMILEDRATNHEHFFDHGIINSHYDMVLAEHVRREPNIAVFLNTSVRGVEAEPVDDPSVPVHTLYLDERAHLVPPRGAPPPGTGPAPTRNGLGRLGGPAVRIAALHASQLGSEKEFVFRAPQFVDATGDGTVGYLAGADFRYGREARQEFGERLAPLVSDEVTLGSTITMRARDVGRPVEYVPPPWIQVYKSLEEIGFDRKLYHVTKPVYGGYWWLEVCNPFHQIADSAAIRDELHRHVLGVWSYIKNHSDFREHAATYALDWIGQVPGKRESRRLMGDVVFTEHDCHADAGAGARWPDGVAYAAWWIDLHIPGGILNKKEPGERENVDENYKGWIRITPTSIPLRAMYSRNVQNLWMAGRCYSTTHIGIGPVRVQLTLALQGQAVGTAAAYALRHGLMPRQTADPAAEHIARVRQQLLKDDVHVLGLKSDDPDDLARGAIASATSERPFDLGEPDPGTFGGAALPADASSAAYMTSAVGSGRGGLFPLDWARGMVVPVTHDRVDAASVFLVSDRSEPVTVMAELHELTRIWDRAEQGNRVVSRAEVTVPPEHCGWISIPFGATVVADRPHRVVLREAPGISWAQAGGPLTGTTAQFLWRCLGGAEPRNAHLPSLQPHEVDIPAYAHWRQHRGIALATRLTPRPHPFGTAAVNNGAAWPEDLPNLWISDPAQPLPQAVTLEFGRVVSFDSVHVSFDTQLDLTTGKRTEFWRAAECVRDWRLEALSGGAWRQIYEESGNYKRKRIARFDPLSASALRLEALATNGDRSARVYEIRVYDERPLNATRTAGPKTAAGTSKHT